MTQAKQVKIENCLVCDEKLTGGHMAFCSPNCGQLYAIWKMDDTTLTVREWYKEIKERR